MVLTHLVLFGFWKGASVSATPVPVVTTTTPSGVKKGRKREITLNLRNVENRESTAEFLKSQLRLRHGIAEPEEPVKPKESKAQRLARQKLEKEALRNMEIERAQEQRRILNEQNNVIFSLLLIGSQ